MPLNKDIQYSRGVNLPLGFVYQSLGDPFCIAQMPSPCPSCWKTLISTSCTHTQPIPKSLWSKYMYLYIYYIILCNIAIVNPQQNHRGTLSIPSCPVLDTHLISDYSQVQSRYLHMKRKILQFQFVWPMEGGHLRRELCFCMTSVYKIMWMIQLYSYPEASSYDPILIFYWI